MAALSNATYGSPELREALIRIPPGTMDGAVVELQERPDGTMAAEIRIPAPSAAIAPAT